MSMLGTQLTTRKQHRLKEEGQFTRADTAKRQALFKLSQIGDDTVIDTFSA